MEELESLGVSVFATHLGIDSRLGPAELWRAFEGPIVIWVHGNQFSDANLDRLIEHVQKFPQIRRFRFTSTLVTPPGFQKLRECYPNIPIEGIRIK